MHQFTEIFKFNSFSFFIFVCQVHVSPEHPRQRGERLGLPWDLHDDRCEPWGCGAGETHTNDSGLDSENVYVSNLFTFSSVFVQDFIFFCDAVGHFDYFKSAFDHI